MRRRPTSNSSMSLFPFLDTLVCTMGALILMLLAMTPKIKERALARQAAAQEAAAGLPAELEPGPEPDPEPEPDAPVVAAPAGLSAEELAAERQRRRDAWLAQAADARSALSARQADFRGRRQHLQEAEQRLRDLQDQILKAHLKSENAGQAAETLDEQVQRLEAQAAVVAQKIAATRKNIDLSNRRQAAAKNEYALVAYDGTSGTTRRPIYIECTGQGFRFLPENETVSPSDLEGFSDGFNPLLAGARTLVQFWARRKRNAGPAEPEPYVLLLVRPSGCFTYYIARKYLSSLGVHWGYELIEEDWKLSIPQADPLAKTLLKETLAAAVQIRRPSKREVAAGERDYGGPFDPREFFESDEGSGRSFGGGDSDSGFGSSGHSGRRIPSIKQGYATRNDRQAADSFPGERPARDIDVAEARTAGGMGDSSAATLAGRSPGGQRGGAALESGIGGSGRRGRGIGGSARGNDDSRSPDGVALAANGSAEGGVGGSATAGNRASGGTGASSTSPDPSSSDAGGDGGDGDSNTPPGGGKRSSGRGRGGRARPASLGGSSELAGNSDGADDNQPQSTGLISDDELLMNPGGAGGAAGEGGLAGLQPGQGSATAGRQSGAPNFADAQASSNAGQSTANPGAGSDGAAQASKPSWLSDPADGSSSSSRSAQMGGPGINFNLGGRKSRKTTSQDNPDDGPRISENSDGQPSSGPAVRANGPRKWGQVGRKAKFGWEKKVKIYLNDKRIVVDNKQHMMLVTPADSGEEIVNHVVAAIDDIADSWGEPQTDFYWVPVVQYVVYPGGDANYARLHTALEQKWGVTSTVEYAADRKDKKAASGGSR